MSIKKTGILLLSMTVLVTSVILSNQAYAGRPDICETNCSREAIVRQLQCEQQGGTQEECALEAEAFLNDCIRNCRSAVGGEFIGIETTSVLVAGAQNTAAWMIPVIVSAIGIGIVIARKF